MRWINLLVTAMVVGAGAEIGINHPQKEQPIPTGQKGNLLLQTYQKVKKRSKLKLQLEQFLVQTYRDKKGKTRIKYTKIGNKYRIKKNDLIEYRLTAFNSTKGETLRNLKIVDPIPKGMVYIPKSANPPAKFSIDNGKSFKSPPVTYLVMEGDKPKKKIAPPEMYTHIMWKVSKLEPQKMLQFRYWAKLNLKLKKVSKKEQRE